MMPRSVVLLAAVFALVVSFGAEANAQTQRRMALLIGNSDYNGDGRIDLNAVPEAGIQGDLRNPVNDVRAVAAMLGSEYGGVAPILDADFAAMNAAITDFAVAVERADREADERGEPRAIVMLYYAGHGLEVANENFLVPARATLPAAELMQGLSAAAARQRLLGRALAVSDILALFSDRGAGVTVIVLDACRNNPWARRARGVQRAGVDTGLAPISPMGSVLVAMSAEPGQTAADGEASNSPFTQAFIEYGGRRELSFLDAFTEMANWVLVNTPARQRPWLVGSPSSRFCLLPCASVTRERVALAIAPELAPDARRSSAEVRAPVVRSVRGLRDFALFRECEQCPEMVVLPAGAFMMGSPAAELGRDDDEDDRAGPGGRPIQMSVGRFAISRFEISGRLWQSCLQAERDACTRQAGVFNSHPVEGVSFDEVRTFLIWLNRAAQGEAGPSLGLYRLPTESEWEYAARATAHTRFSWGDEDPSCDQAARNGANFSRCASAGAMPVGSFQPNAFGLFDTAGNVWEFNAGCYAAALSRINDAAQPCTAYVVRGGGWSDFPPYLRSAYREQIRASEGRVEGVGFRVARSL